MSTATAEVLDLEECEVVNLKDDSPDYKLDARVRCDHSATTGSEYTALGSTAISCGSQAYVEVTLRSGGTLTFCKHHAEKVEPALKPLAKKWYSETSRLIENRKVGSEN